MTQLRTAITLTSTGQYLRWTTGDTDPTYDSGTETSHAITEPPAFVAGVPEYHHTVVNNVVVEMATQGEKDAAVIENSRIRVISATAYTVLPSDDGCRLYFTAATAVTVTIDAGLGANFMAFWRQVGAGLVTFVEGTASIENRQDQFATAGVKAMGSLVMSNVVDTVDLGGDTA